jgi:hypothetical protein
MATEITAKGDLIAGTGSATFDNLPVGTNGQTLVADSSTATGLKWATPASGGGMTLLSTTTLSGTRTTILSIDQTYVYLYVLVYGVSNTSATGRRRILVNTQGSAVPNQMTNATTTVISDVDVYMSNNGTYPTYTDANNCFMMQIDNYALTTNYKPVAYRGVYNSSVAYWGNGGYNANTAITEISIDQQGGGSFNAGTCKIYGVK